MEGCTAHDLDSVAGVLKLYFRSLEPPLFPPDLFGELLASAGKAGRGLRPAGWEGPLPSGQKRTHVRLSGVVAVATELEAIEERVELVSLLLARLPEPVLVVLRYLFTFLNQ